MRRSSQGQIRAPENSEVGWLPPTHPESGDCTRVCMCTGSDDCIQEVVSAIEKPASDEREYRALVLTNQLKIFLVSDPATDKAAVSITVAVGSLSDPEEFPGIAHFCEHMLFMGSETFPDENDYEKFITEHGGFSNAFTSGDQTTYYHDIVPDSLVPSLDRLAQFLIAPLFTASATEREVKAVDSEHAKNIADDDRRHCQLIKATSDPSHPYSRFGTGNLATLWIKPLEKNADIRSELLKFHATYYSANLITVAILGSESIDDLTKIATSLFHLVVNKNVELPRWSQQPVNEEQLQTCTYEVPIKDLRSMSILFPIPDMTPFYRSGSDQYLTHLIAHEGPGSILSYLKRKNWANELSAGSETSARGFGMLYIDIELTEDGLKCRDDIVLLVFHYLKLLKESGPLKWIWEEIRTVNATSFRFRDKVDPIDYVSGLSGSMIAYPLEHILSAYSIITEFDPERILSLLSYLSTDNFRLIVTTKENASKANLKEEFYGIEYSVEKIPQELIQKWSDCGLHEALKLPMVNEFIPTEFDLKKRHDTGIVPHIILSTPISTVWFLQDNEYMMPKACVSIQIFRAGALPLTDPLEATLSMMLVATLEDSLNEFAYHASVAGLWYSIGESLYGLEICCVGYNHKLHILLDRVLQKLIHYTPDSQRFEVLKEALSRDLRNWEKDQPREHAEWYLTYLLRQKRWTCDQWIETLPDVTPENVEKFAKKFVSKLRLEWLIYGNVDQEEAKNLVVNCENMLQAVGSVALPPEECTLMREIRLNPGEDLLYNKENLYHSDSSTLVIHQCDPYTIRNSMLMELLQQIMCEPLFDTLRTREQLGYIVSSYARNCHGAQGLVILIQSKFHPDFLDCRIDCFLETFYGILVNMSEVEFLKNSMALKVQKMEKPKNLWDRGQAIWTEIVCREYQFDRQNVELQELDTIKKQDVVTYFSELIGEGSPSSSRKRLTVHVVSMADDGAGKKDTLVVDEARNKYPRTTTEILDVEEWKSCHDFYEQPGPLIAL